MIKTGKTKKDISKFPNSCPKMTIKNAGKCGKGVFALEKIKKNRLITKMLGERLGLQECWHRIDSEDETLTDAFQIDNEIYLDLKEPFRFFNHSCEPNAGIINENDLVAIRDIKRGEEITFDYSTTVGPNIPLSEWTMRCLCGSLNCREIIGNVLTIPIEQLKDYKDKKCLQDYIIRELKKISKIIK
jgi:hypothetical protein